MGIDLNLVPILRDIAARHGLGGDVLTLGEQTLGFDGATLAAALGRTDIPAGPLRQRDFFAALGFASSESADIHAGEGADHILDLNAPETPEHLRAKYEAIINGGTLEHVFHVPNALSHVTRMLRPGGVVIHINPCNNWVDHGFYQFGPTLLFDYCRAAGFTPLESLVGVRLSPTHWRVHATPEQEAEASASAWMPGPALHIFAARAQPSVREAAVPMQRIYDPNAPTPARTRWFPAFDIIDGVAHTRKVADRRNLAGRIEPSEGFAWRVAAPEFNRLADTMEAQRRSPLIVLENGEPLGPPHSAHDAIRRWGRGRFSHWCGDIVFSTSDNTIPIENGRTYEAALLSDFS